MAHGAGTVVCRHPQRKPHPSLRRPDPQAPAAGGHWPGLRPRGRARPRSRSPSAPRPSSGPAAARAAPPSGGRGHGHRGARTQHGPERPLAGRAPCWPRTTPRAGGGGGPRSSTSPPGGLVVAHGAASTPERGPRRRPSSPSSRGAPHVVFGPNGRKTKASPVRPVTLSVGRCPAGSGARLPETRPCPPRPRAAVPSGQSVTAGTPAPPPCPQLPPPARGASLLQEPPRGDGDEPHAGPPSAAPAVPRDTRDTALRLFHPPGPCPPPPTFVKPDGDLEPPELPPRPRAQGPEWPVLCFLAPRPAGTVAFGSRGPAAPAVPSFPADFREGTGWEPDTPAAGMGGDRADGRGTRRQRQTSRLGRARGPASRRRGSEMLHGPHGPHP